MGRTKRTRDNLSQIIMEQTEELIFQDTPDFKLADELYELGQKAKKEYGEPVFGEFLITQSLLYRTGRFQNEYIRILDLMDDMEGQTEEQALDDLMKQIPFDKDKIL